MSNLNDTLQSTQRLDLNFVLLQKFLAIAEVAQEPGKLPQGLRSTRRARSNRATDEWLRLKYIETKLFSFLLLKFGGRRCSVGIRCGPMTGYRLTEQ
jgi:hypothetical protein